MRADHVKCTSCEKEMYVQVGTEVCPNCKLEGRLAWVNPDIQEVDVDESLILADPNPEIE